MSLATYADLQARVAEWLARTDLNPFIPDMITLFEAAAARRLKVRPMETTTSLTPSGGSVALPSDYLGHRSLTWTGDPSQELDYVHPAIFNSEYLPDENGAILGIPVIYTIQGGTITIKPSDDTPLTFDYFQKNPALSASLNWLYTNYPDVYLFGTLCEANFFNKGSALPLAAMWKQRRDEAFDEIQRVDFNERQGMAIRVFGITP